MDTDLREELNNAFDDFNNTMEKILEKLETEMVDETTMLKFKTCFETLKNSLENIIDLKKTTIK
jgi:hypothetical protein